MKRILLSLAIAAVLFQCHPKTETPELLATSNIIGTWRLQSSLIIEKGDTTATFPVKDQEMIKQITDTHFSFMKHDTNQGKGDTAVFDAGAGTYTLKGDDYTENLQYCNYREWENHAFKFKLRIQGDTLVQTGFEKIDSLGVDREIREVYVKIKR